MTNSQLIQKLVGLVKRETEITLEVIRHFREVEERDLHLEMSYSSLFDFATKFLGYSEGAAFRRINAMRLMKAEPDVEQMIKTGELTLSTAARVEAFCRKTSVDRAVAVQQVLGKGTRDAERALFELAPDAIPVERTRPVSATHTEVRMILDAEMMADLNRIRELLSHADPNMSCTEVFARSMKALLRKIDPEKHSATSAPKPRSENEMRKPKTEKSESNANIGEPTADIHERNPDIGESTADINSATNSETKTPKSSPDARLAKGVVRRIVINGDQGRCTYRDPETGRRCNSRHLTQVDHIEPWSRGGKTEVEKLRVLCRSHNQYLARQFL